MPQCQTEKGEKIAEANFAKGFNVSENANTLNKKLVPLLAD